MSEKPSLGTKPASKLPVSGVNLMICDCRFAEIKENKNEKTKEEYPWRVQLQSFEANLSLLSAVEPDLMTMYKYAFVKASQSEIVSSFDNNHRAKKVFDFGELIILGDKQ